MNAYELLVEIADEEILKRLKNGFSGLVEFSKEVEVLDWEPEFAIHDKNPEVWFQLRELDRLFEAGEIDEKTYLEKRKQLERIYTSVTMGVAFIEDKAVSFREKPSLGLWLHEVGHVYFRAGDLVWSSTFGGAELLLAIHLNTHYLSSEDSVRDLLRILYIATESPETAHEMLLNRFGRAILVYKTRRHIGALMMAMGSIICEDVYDPDDPRWDEVEVKEDIIRYAIANILDGVLYHDPQAAYLATLAGWIKQQLI